MKNYQIHTRSKDHHTWKSHLEQLPVVEQIPYWQGEGEFACLVIPIFSFDGSTKFIERYLAKAAAWALKTWKENTDAKAMDIPCFIYVEDNIYDVTEKILLENSVPKANIKVAKYDKTKWLGKCLQPVFDKALEKYKYIVTSDNDLFAVRNKADEILNIFERIESHKPKGFGCKTFSDNTLPVYWMPPLKEIQEYDHDTFKGDLVEKWQEVVSLLAGTDISKYVTGGVPDTRPWTGLMVIEQGIFKDKDWLQLACNTLGDDEAVIYAWSKLSSDNCIYDVDGMDIDLFVDMVQFIVACYHSEHETKKTVLNNVDFRDLNFHKPCLLHHFGSHDHKFYKAIGAY